MNLIFQLATTVVAEMRTLVDDIGRGFVLGGVAGAFVVVRQKAHLAASRQTLVASRWALAGAIVFPLLMLILDWAFE